MDISGHLAAFGKINDGINNCSAVIAIGVIPVKMYIGQWVLRYRNDYVCKQIDFIITVC